MLEAPEVTWRLWTALVVAGLFLASGFLIERDRGRTRSWRAIVLLAVAVSLAVLILRPTWEQDVDPTTATVLTRGGVAPWLAGEEERGGHETWVVALPGAEAVPAVPPAPDLATYLRRNPQVRRLVVAGDGLEPWDLEATDVAIEVGPDSPESFGIADIDWERRIELGEPLRVTGTVTGPEGWGARLRLEGPGSVGEVLEWSSESPAGEQVFGLEARPPTIGRFVYQLILESLAGGLEWRGSIDVEVFAPRRLAILWLEDAPGFETRSFKRWAAGVRSSLAIRSRVSRDRYHLEFHNLDELRLDRLTPDSLAAFDLIVTDLRSWQRLGAAQRSVVLEAVEKSGHGLLLRLGVLDPESVRVAAGLGFVTRKVGEADRRWVSVDLAGRSDLPVLETAPFQIDLGPGSQPLVTDRAGRSLAASRPAGNGTLGATLLTQTFPWQLEGHVDAQHAYWQRLIRAVARPALESRWHLPRGPVLVDEPLDLVLDVGQPPVELPRVTVELPDGDRVPVSMRQDPARASRWVGRVWPAERGWHSVLWEDGTGAAIRAAWHVSEPDRWVGFQRQRRQGATRLASLGRVATSSGDTIRVGAPAPLWPFWLIVVGGLGALWLDERAGA